MVSGCRVGRWAPRLAAPAAQTQNYAAAVQFAHVLREANAEFHQAPPPALPAAVRRPRPARIAARARVRASLRPADRAGIQTLRRSHRAGHRQLAQHARRQPALPGQSGGQIRDRRIACRAARPGSGLRFARAGDERSHRRPQLLERRRRFHRARRHPHLLRRTFPLPALHRPVLETAARRRTLLGHAADRLAGEFQRSAPQRHRATQSARHRGERNAQLHGGECGGAPPRVRRQEGARPRHRRGLRQQEVHAQRLTVLNGRVLETKQVDVPENGRATVEFLSLDVPYGRNKGEVRIDTADSLPADDTFNFSVERSDPRHALFVQESAGQPRTGLFQGRPRCRRPIRLRDRSGHRRSGDQRLPVQVRLRGPERPGRRAACLRECAARIRPRRRQRVDRARPPLRGPQPRAGHRRRHSGGALRRP